MTVERNVIMISSMSAGAEASLYSGYCHRFRTGLGGGGGGKFFPEHLNSKSVSARPSDPDTMTNSFKLASSSGKKGEGRRPPLQIVWAPIVGSLLNFDIERLIFVILSVSDVRLGGRSELTALEPAE